MTERPGTILVVDDTEAGRYATVRLLQNLGFAVREAASGGEALQKAADRPDLIVLDVQLPDLDGFEVCRRLRENPTTASIPVLYLSAHFVREAEVAQGLAYGGDGYLIQPVDPVELAATVNSLLRLRRVESAMQTQAQRWQTMFDAIGDGVCLVDADGTLLQCNRSFARLVGARPDALVRRRWEEIHKELGLPRSDGAFHDMLASGQRERREWWVAGSWYRITADPMLDESGTLRGAVLILADVSERKRAEAAEATTQIQSGRIAHLEEELRALERLADRTHASVTAQLFGSATLRETAPEQFTRLSEEYAAIMDQAIEQRNYKVDHHTSDRLRQLGDRLGFLQAGPRDVVELCTAALESKRAKVQPLKFQAYLEEGRLLALELMGDLTSYYRYHSLGARGGSPRPPAQGGAR